MSGRLAGKTGLVVGIANGDSIAAGCARAFHSEGAELIITHMNEKAKPHVAPIAEEVHAKRLMPLDVTDDTAMDAVFTAVAQEWGQLDFLLHAVAYCLRDDLHGRVVDSSREGFALAMDISCHSFLRMAKRAEHLIAEGGALFTVRFYGAEQVVDDCNIMGPVKAALEASVSYLAAELGPAGIRVHSHSPGPVVTRAASGSAQFDEMLREAAERSPLPTEQTPEDVGALVAFLASDAAKHITGNITYIDAGYHVMS